MDSVPAAPPVPVLTALAAELEDWGPKDGALAGSPHERGLLLHDDGHTQVGIWECSPGSWRSSKEGVGELMHFVAGRGRISDADGDWEIAPGAVRWFPDGWSGVWTVEETVRKVFAIVATRRASAG